jgi:hypothetical protein
MHFSEAAIFFVARLVFQYANISDVGIHDLWAI